MERKILNSQSEIRLDKFLSNTEKDISRTQIQKLILNGCIKVDDYIVKPSFQLKGSEIITVDFDAKNSNFNRENILGKENIPLDIIYEDDSIIAINKSAGLVVHPGAGNQQGTMLNGLLYHFSKLSNLDMNRPGIVHRLDKYTSGVIIVAKTNHAHYYLSEQFANRKIKKKYRAIVWGRVKSDGCVEGFINRNIRNRISFQMATKGKYSKSSYKLIKNYKILSYLDIRPLTGRTHQIRVHMKSIGHPILLDDLYSGGIKNIYSFHEKYFKLGKQIVKEMNRFALHAYEISFLHPENKQKMTLNAPIPTDFNSCLNQLEKLYE